MPSSERDGKLSIPGWAIGAVSTLVAVFLAGVLAVQWADSRYVRREDFKKLQDDVDDHKSSPTGGHADNALVRIELTAIRTDLAWIKLELARRETTKSTLR